MGIEQIMILGLLIHFLADFGLQTHEQATLKSSSMKSLCDHTLVYSAVWLIALLPLYGWPTALAFACVTWIAHTVTDYFTSRVAKSFFVKEDYHNGFVVVGFDQVLHYLQLYYTFKILISG